MSIATTPDRACLSVHELKSLLDPVALSDADAERLTSHLGDCPACQKRLDALALGEDFSLGQDVRNAQADLPAKDSAYWEAVASVKAEVSQTKAQAVGPNDSAVHPKVQEMVRSMLQKTSQSGWMGKLGPFDVKRVIGQGGMGVVLQGFDASLHRDVAIKVLDPKLADNQTARQRFCREARAAASVSHDNLVTVFQVNDDPNTGLPYLVMQLVAGESLEQRLRRQTRLSVLETVRIGMQAAAGLAAAHAIGLIHRDIKPGNILLEVGTDKAKLTDFGLARAAEDLKLTKTGFVAGTPLYMAPEQARGDEIDTRADLFSLGSVLYESLTGRPPFEGKTPLAVLKRVEGEAHTPLRELNSDVPEWLEDTIDRLLAKKPEDRFQSALELSEYLAFKMTMLKSGSGGTPAVCAAEPKRSAPTSAKKGFCVKTAGTLASVFGVGLTIGAVGAALMAPSFIEPKVVPVPVQGEVVTVMGAPGDVNVGPEPKTVLQGMSGSVWAVAISPQGLLVAIGSEAGTINVWNRQSGKIEVELHPDKENVQNAHSGPVWSVNFNADGNRLISVGDEGTVKTWDVKTGKILGTLPLGFSARTATINPVGNYVAVGDREGRVRVFDLTLDAEVLKYEQGSTVNAIAFHPDGLTLASAGTDGNVIVWDFAGKR